MRKRRWMICALWFALRWRAVVARIRKKEANTAVIEGDDIKEYSAERTRPGTPRRMQIMMTVWVDLPEHSAFRPA